MEKVQPKDLTASEISVRLGATWLPQDIVEQFMFGELNAMLDMDKKEHPILDVEPDESVEVIETKCKVLER